MIHKPGVVLHHCACCTGDSADGRRRNAHCAFAAQVMQKLGSPEVACVAFATPPVVTKVRPTLLGPSNPLSASCGLQRDAVLALIAASLHGAYEFHNEEAPQYLRCVKACLLLRRNWLSGAAST